MKQVMVRYKVKPESADENRRLVENVFEELNENRPEGLRYMTFQLDDGVSFVHVASIETEDGTNPLGATEAFKAFQSELKARCDELPAAIELNEVGSYRFFEG